VLDEILQERVVSSRGRRTPRAVKRKLSKFPVRRQQRSSVSPNLAKAVCVLK
jgi:hypothetical protein